jgi:nucleotide-binding universal stress UspA family protein
METTTLEPKVATRFERILFATDFSPAAAHAIPYVTKLAKHYQSKLVALHVRAPVVNPMTQPATWAVDIEYAASVDEENRELLRKTFAGIPTETVIETGGILDSINDTLQESHCDLVVIGTRGRTGVHKFFLGSIAEEIFRHVACPVLTVGPHTEEIPGTRAEFREILFATDFSPESKRAAAYAASLAQEFGARLTLLHVVPKFSPNDVISWAQLQEYSKELMRHLMPPELQSSRKLDFVVEQGDPAERILALAELRKSDLIVLGTQVPSGFPGAATHLPIAVAHKVVSSAACPVLTVRHTAK